MGKRKSRIKEEPTDGLGPKELKMIHKAVRQVWFWSRAHRLAKKRALHKDGFYRCENSKCSQKGEPVPHVFVDHISPVGEVGGPNYIQKMFIPSKGLQCICKKCHDPKTKHEQKARREALKSKGRAVKTPLVKDFY